MKQFFSLRWSFLILASSVSRKVTVMVITYEKLQVELVNVTYEGLSELNVLKLPRPLHPNTPRHPRLFDMIT